MPDDLFTIAVYRFQGKIYVDLLEKNTSHEKYELECKEAEQTLLLFERIDYDLENFDVDYQLRHETANSWQALHALSKVDATRYAMELLLAAFAEKLLKTANQ